MFAAGHGPAAALRLAGWHRRQAGVGGPRSARDFIGGTLLPALREALADEPRGNKHYLAGYDAGLKAVARFLKEARHLWDVPE